MKHPEEARQFYESLPQPVLVGTEACGFTLWFEELLMELGDELRIGDAEWIGGGGTAAEDRRTRRRTPADVAAGGFIAR